MQNLITSEQAKKITGGRTPLVPVEYEQAVKALKACSTLDEAKYWSDKADALAAWAKIYKSDEASLEARRLRLHAFRRMAELASELQPMKALGRDKGGKHLGNSPGPVSLLRSQGFERNRANVVMRIGNLKRSEFDALVAAKKPPSPLTVRSHGLNPTWGEVQKPLISARSAMRNKDPVNTARSLSANSIEAAKALADEVTEWLDAFEQALPKVKR